MLDSDRLLAAYQKARDDLLAEREPAGHWVGELSTSGLSTATAVSALTLVDRHSGSDGHRFADLIAGGIRYLASHQNPDGGWGDTDRSHSNIATTMLAVAAFHLAGKNEEHATLLQKAEQYIDSLGRIAGLRRRYGRDETFAVPILTNCALAGLVPWKEVSPLPFELACFPQRMYRFLRLPVVSYAIPALVAIGQARFFHRPPLNPLLRWIRQLSVNKSLAVLRRMQPASGGYLEAVPLTSFVVMSLASTGRVDHPVTQSGVKFIVDSLRPDGSWPIDTNLATWNTTLAINALAGAGEDVARLDCLDWLLACQQQEVHPFTGAEPGGWGWSDLSGSVPDGDDTPGAMLALRAWHDAPSCPDHDRPRIVAAIRNGAHWLLDLQNGDGGWPTFCRGWGKLPFDRSGADLTAHTLRALAAWRAELPDDARIRRSLDRGLKYLTRVQQADGSWIPLWFGNQDHPQEENPVYGTAKVLLAYRDGGQSATESARRGFRWLLAAQNEDGSWGGSNPPMARGHERAELRGSQEETTLAVEALLAALPDSEAQQAIDKGLAWIMRQIDENQYRESSPIGFYFAKLWYYERLYPLTFTVSALGQAVRRLLPRPEQKPLFAHLPHTPR